MKQAFLGYFKQFGINIEVKNMEILTQMNENPRMRMLIGWFILLPEVMNEETSFTYQHEIEDCAKIYRVLERDVFLKHPILRPYMIFIKSNIDLINPAFEVVPDITSKVDALANVMWYQKYNKVAS